MRTLGRSPGLWLRVAAICGAAALIGALHVSSAGAATAPTSLFSGQSASDLKVYADSSVELGVRFKARTSGDLTAIRFLKAEGSEDSHVVSLWNSGGLLLASATSTNETASGWQEVPISAVRLLAGKTYVASYHTSKYVATAGYFSRSVRGGKLHAPAGRNGVYRYGNVPSFPDSSYRSTNYWVDVVFGSNGNAVPGSTTTTVLPDPSPTTSVTTTSTAPKPAPTTTTVVSTTSSTSPAGGGAAVPGWKLTSANTGLAAHGLNCGALPLYTGSDSPAAGTVISQKRITRPLNLAAGSITIEKSCVQPISVGQGMPVLTTTDFNTLKMTTTTVTIRDSDIDGSLLDSRLAALSVGFLGIADLKNNYIHDFGSGIGLMNTGKTLSSVVEGNYVTKLRAWGDPAREGNHSDGFTVRDFDSSTTPSRTLVVRNNRFDSDSGNDTGAFFIQPYAGDIHNVTAEGNLLEGRGYQLMLETHGNNTYRNVKAINNRMSGTGYGAGYVDKGPGWTSQSENYINDTTKPDNKGRAVRF